MSDTLPDPPTPASRGRRSNGLPATDWGALVDLDPRLSEALLASLGAAGVAAYVEPARGEDNISRAAQHPPRPLDRLWVDPGHADAARQVVTAEVADLSSLLAETDPGATAHGFVHAIPRTAAARVLPPPALPDPPAKQPADLSAPADPDEAWRQIVEGYHREADGPVAPWPVSEDLDAPPRPRLFPSRPERAGDPAAEPDPPTRPAPQSSRDLPGWVEPAPLDDEGHYVPPPPPPIPRLAPKKIAAAVTVLVGVLLMFAPGLLLQPRTTGVAIFGVLLTVGGAAAMVYLMRDAPPADSGPDDGAVV